MKHTISLITLRQGGAGVFVNGKLVQQYQGKEHDAKELATALAMALGAKLDFLLADRPGHKFWTWREVVRGMPGFDEDRLADLQEGKARVLIAIKDDGVEYVCDEGIDVAIFDFNKSTTHPEEVTPVPNSFNDLAIRMQVPCETESDERPVVHKRHKAA